MTNDNSLSKFSTLLVNETAEFIAGRRILDANNGAAAILDEVDQTVLGTSLRFHAKGMSLELAVNGRRVISVQPADVDRSDPASRQLLTSDDRDQHAWLRSQIEALSQTAQDDGQLSVETRALPDDLKDATGRVSVNMLNFALEKEEAATGALTPRRLIKEFATYTEAMVTFDDAEVVESSGDADIVAALSELAMAEAQSERGEQPSLTVVEDKISSGLTSAIATIDGTIVAIAIETECLFDLVEDFKRLLREED